MYMYSKYSYSAYRYSYLISSLSFIVTSYSHNLMFKVMSTKGTLCVIFFTMKLWRSSLSLWSLHRCSIFIWFQKLLESISQSQTRNWRKKWCNSWKGRQIGKEDESAERRELHRESWERREQGSCVKAKQTPSETYILFFTWSWTIHKFVLCGCVLFSFLNTAIIAIKSWKCTGDIGVSK